MCTGIGQFQIGQLWLRPKKAKSKGEVEPKTESSMQIQIQQARFPSLISMTRLKINTDIQTNIKGKPEITKT